jgi:hypothetical protein
MMTDHDAIDVATQHGAVPHTRMIAQLYITDHDGGAGEVNLLAQTGLPK